MVPGLSEILLSGDKGSKYINAKEGHPFKSCVAIRDNNYDNYLIKKHFSARFGMSDNREGAL